MPPHSTWPARGHIPSLDGLRAASILVVFLDHGLQGRLINGGAGVTVFFFISGYLITTLMLRERLRTGRLALGAFWMRRLLRLGPPLALALGLAVVLAGSGAIVARLAPFAPETPAARDAGLIDLPTLAAQVFFYFNYYYEARLAQPIAGTIVLWSLSVEEHFYLLWPLVFPALASSLLAGPGDGRRRGWAWGLGGMALAIAAWRLWRFQVWGDSETALYFLSDTRMDSLLYGCALSMAQYAGAMPRIRQPLPWLALGLALFFLPLPRDLVVLRYSLQGLALMGLFHLAITRPEHWTMRPLNWAPVARIGVWSYSFYLVHHVILFALAPVLRPETGGIGALLPWALASGSLALAWAAGVHHLVERPMARLRHRLDPQREPQ